MIIGAYQFKVTSNIEYNLKFIKSAIRSAAKEKVKLLVFPECALTGYPPRDIDSSSDIDFDKLDIAYGELQEISTEYEIGIVVGTITKDEEKYYNSALVFLPNGQRKLYHKRALWGWDKDNFVAGNENGVFEFLGMKIGVRICFEVRFPEYFRELYKEQTDLNIVIFYDVSDKDDKERYDLIRGHIRTRAVENVCNILTVNTIYPYQTAPTALYDKSGKELCYLERNIEGLLVYSYDNLENREMDFGERGRREISNLLVDETK